MAEWIGSLIGGLPLWVVIPVVCLVGLVWLLFGPYGTDNFFEIFKKKEWWQDRQKRLEKEADKAKVKMKAKKG